MNADQQFLWSAFGHSMPLGRIVFLDTTNYARRLNVIAATLLSCPPAASTAVAATGAASAQFTTTSMAAREVAVVGGGVSGLYCASVLSKHGHKVTVFDLGKYAPGEWLKGRVDVGGYVVSERAARRLVVSADLRKVKGCRIQIGRQAAPAVLSGPRSIICAKNSVHGARWIGSFSFRLDDRAVTHQAVASPHARPPGRGCSLITAASSSGQ